MQLADAIYRSAREPSGRLKGRGLIARNANMPCRIIALNLEKRYSMEAGGSGG
jgi:hypothetical protein